CRPDAQLAVHAPEHGVLRVVLVIQDGNVAPVVAAVDRHADFDPPRALPLAGAVLLALGADSLAAGLLLPEHAQEQPASLVLLPDAVHGGRAAPVEGDDVGSAQVGKVPALLLG